MKTHKALLLFVCMGFVSWSYAQHTPRTDARQHQQRSRIRGGVQSGELTAAEATQLRMQQDNIRRSERMAKADGKVTAGERVRLQRQQQRASRNIARQKHDRQDRPF